MPEFNVPLQKALFSSITVEADDYNEAVEKALQEAEEQLPGLCHHCSGGGYGYTGPGIDEGAWDVVTEE